MSYQGDLEHAISEIASMADNAPELNMSNYNVDQVAEINNAMIEICLFAGSLVSRICEGQDIGDLVQDVKER